MVLSTFQRPSTLDNTGKRGPPLTEAGGGPRLFGLFFLSVTVFDAMEVFNSYVLSNRIEIRDGV